MSAEIGLQIEMQWEDSRLLSTPCRYLFEHHPETTTITSGMKQRDIESTETFLDNFWLPSLVFASEVSQTDTSAFYTLGNSSEAWLQPSNPGNASRATCSDGCTRMTYRTSLTAWQSTRDYGDYKSYPFDTHDVTFRFGVEDGALDCSSALAQLTSEQLRQSVQPQNGEWALHTDSPVRLRNARERSVELPNKCELIVKISRQSMVQVIKSLVLSVVTVVACLLANYMHPADHTGDRAAIVLVAGLILTANMQADLKLGPINYLIWQDGFNLILIVVTILALVQTMVVHRVWHYGEMMGLALTIDRVCTGCILYFTFPLLVLADVLTAFGSTFGLGIALLVVTPIASSLYIWRAIRTRELLKRTNEAAAVRALVEDKAPVGDPRREEQLSRAFTVFDRDETGYLAPDELRRLLLATYPSQPAKKVSSVVRTIEEHCFLHGRLTADQWLGAQQEIDELLASGAVLPPTLAKSETSRLGMGFLQGKIAGKLIV